MGANIGVGHVWSSKGGVAVVNLSGGGVAGKPGSLSSTSPVFGFEANPLGFGWVQTSLGVDFFLEDPSVTAAYAGLRFESRRWRISPRITYTTFHTEHPDYSIGTNYVSGFGAGVQVSYAVGGTEP